MKKYRNKKIMKKKAKVNGPNHCIHRDEDPCVFIQIELHLAKNNVIYHDKGEYEKDPVAYHSARYKRVFQSTSFVLWKGPDFRQLTFYRIFSFGVVGLSILQVILWRQYYRDYVVLRMDQIGKTIAHPAKIAAIGIYCELHERRP
jgi:hypothetical protein